MDSSATLALEIQRVFLSQFNMATESLWANAKVGPSRFSCLGHVELQTDTPYRCTDGEVTSVVPQYPYNATAQSLQGMLFSSLTTARHHANHT